MIKYFHLKHSNTTPCHSGPGSNGNGGVLHISQSSSTGAAPSDTVSCHTQDTRWGRSYPSAEMLSASSPTPVFGVLKGWVEPASHFGYTDSKRMVCHLKNTLQILD